MASYDEARDKLINTQINKLKYEAKNRTVTKSRITKKTVQDKELPNE